MPNSDKVLLAEIKSDVDIGREVEVNGQGQEFVKSSKFEFDTSGMWRMRVNSNVTGLNKCETFTWKRSDV